MTKSQENKILWVKPDNNRRRLYARLKPDGALCFGRAMLEKLPRKIRIGLLSEEYALFVGADTEGEIALPRNGVVKVSRIVLELRGLGVEATSVSFV